MTIKLESYIAGRWTGPGADAVTVASAIDGAAVAHAGGAPLDMGAALDHGYAAGAALREMGFHDRARILKALATYLNERRDALYELSYQTGATLADSKIDIDGGIGTTFLYAAKGRREMPDGQVYLDGDVEGFSRNGTFIGQHICTPVQGAAVQINAYNFPVWGMLEKFAPAFLAGVPSIVKPATATSYVTEACVRMMVESGLLPDGAVQLVIGGVGDLLDRLGPQDSLAFTGSAATALKLRGHKGMMANSVRFTAEQDSLNASMLGPDVTPDAPEFDLYVKEITREMTAKAGQKCTAIRRIIAPDAIVADVIDAIAARLAKITVGDPRDEATRMGALVSLSQQADVREKTAKIGAEARLAFGGELSFAGADKGAFVAPHLFHCENPDAARAVHEEEAFGPVSTVMGYRDLAHGLDLVNRGGGSLVMSLITHDPAVAREAALKSAAWHGRIYINDRTSMKEATGHGAPLPHMTHGGPGRAGGGEELGGIRAVKHYMQRTAIQGSPDMITAIGGIWTKGSTEVKAHAHPFTRTFNEVEIGETIHSALRTITLEDIETFAHFTGDTFYAHMDDEAAKANPFFPGRVAHGYLLLSFAAGLFVSPDPGPVLANTGLNNLSFQKPVSPGDSIAVRLVVKRKTRRTDEYGEVRWDVTLTNQDGDQVATYELLTMNEYERG